MGKREHGWLGSKEVQENSMPRIMSDLGYLYSVGYERKERVLVKAERSEVGEKRRT